MSTSPAPDYSSLSAIALDTARAAGASYAELRISRHRNQYISTREEHVQATGEWESSGFGLRVLVDGTWGFASSTVIDDRAIGSAVTEAVAIARASNILVRTPVELAPVGAYKATWTTPMEINPFDVPIGEKIELLLSINREALKAPGTRFCNSMFFATHEWKYFASSEGSEITQDLYRIWPSFNVTAIAADGSDFQSRSGLCMPSGEGYEYCSRFPLLEDARKAGEDAVEKLKSPSVEPGVRDLVLMPSHTWLVIHESIGHATELDRALGFEANYAGTSFVTPDLLGSLKYASDVVTVVGDRTQPRGLATVGFDDEGVEAKRFDIIRDGESWSIRAACATARCRRGEV